MKKVLSLALAVILCPPLFSNVGGVVVENSTGGPIWLQYSSQCRNELFRGEPTEIESPSTLVREHRNCIFSNIIISTDREGKNRILYHPDGNISEIYCKVVSTGDGNIKVLCSPRLCIKPVEPGNSGYCIETDPARQ
jgi:hypothetical protein